MKCRRPTLRRQTHPRASVDVASSRMRTRTAHLRATLAAAALTAVAAQTCDVCHLHYYHKVRRPSRRFSPRDPGIAFSRGTAP